MPNAGQDAFLAAVEAAISSHRLRLGFQLRAGETPEILLGRHLRNLALAEALYPVLQTLELTLRNSIDETLEAAFPASTFGQPWLSATSVVLTARDRDEVANVESRLRREHKDVTRHRIVAGLSLGFWTGLLTRKYEISNTSSHIPRHGVQTALWPRHLRSVFPHLPKRFLTRGYIYGTLAPLASLRNAIFHHRPIWNEKLSSLHVSATEAIGWISPEAQRLILQVDRFPAVHQRGEDSYRRLLVDAVKD
jgi:hypothetical protein